MFWRSCNRQRFLLVFVILALGVMACHLSFGNDRIVPASTATQIDMPDTIKLTDSPVQSTGLEPDSLNWIRDLAFDSQGNLWAAGPGGVVQWDLANGGYTVYTSVDGLVHQDSYALMAAPDDSIWVATWGGVSRFKDGIWVSYGLNDGLLEDVTRSIALTNDGLLWFAHTAGISVFDGAEWGTYPLDDKYTQMGNLVFIQSIFAAPDDVLWVSSDCPLLHFENDLWTEYQMHFRAGCATSVAFAPDSTIWVGTSGNGVFHVVGEDWIRYSVYEGLAHNAVRSIAIAPDGMVWIATWAGVSRFDGQNWTNYTSADGLAGNDVWTIEIAADNTLWFGTYSGGISHFDGTTWETYRIGDDAP